MGCKPSRSLSSSPEPENNNDDWTANGRLGKISKNSGLDPNFMPDPKCGVDIRLSPTISQVDEDGAGRPARVDVKDKCQVKTLTGEESQYEQQLEDGIQSSHRSLGIMSTEKIYRLLKNIGDDSLFEDPDFPADREALFYSERSEEELSHYSWIRPHQLVSHPRVFVDGTSRRDVIQGVLGDCWLLSTCAAIAKKEDLLYKVINPNQTLYGADYTGLIEVKLWRYGDWVTVYIDDRLPQKNGSYCYARCSDPNEFWVALIEKAYAKLHGSYEGIEGGMPIEAMVDLTGGLAERYELKHSSKHKTLYKYLRKSFASQAFITCSRKGDWRHSRHADKNGLVQGHAYTITGLYRVSLDTEDEERVCLVRVRNPWGDKNEWRGSWSDGDKAWDLVSNEVKKEMGLHYMHDGEFWIEFFNDFCREFEEVSICTLGPDFDQDGNVDVAKYIKIVFGEWSAGTSAGGCRNDLKLFSTNPQFLLTIHPDDDDASEDSTHHPADPKCQIIICLAQEHRRSTRERKVRMLQIGFCVYRATHSQTRLHTSHFMYHYDCGTSGPYINYREVFARFELSAGSYVIVPATFQAGDTGNFMIRVYSENMIDIKCL